MYFASYIAHSGVDYTFEDYIICVENKPKEVISMKKSTTVLWFLASILMIVAGIVCFCLPVDTTMSVFAYVVGAIVLIIGIVEIVGFFTTAGFVGGGAFLADGIITTLLGIILLANKGVVAGFIPFIFAMWFIIEGISELSLSISASKYRVPYWWTLLIFSILEILFGFLTFFDPIGGAISMTIMVGVFLITHGISMLGDWIVALRVKKFFKGFVQRAAVFNENEMDDSACDDQR